MTFLRIFFTIIIAFCKTISCCIIFRLKVEMAKRSYKEAFLKLGFAELDGKPKCVVCLKVKLQRHLKTNHPNCADKDVEFFRRKLKSIQGQRNVVKAFTSENKLAVYLSYVASYQIAKQKKSSYCRRRFNNASYERDCKNYDW